MAVNAADGMDYAGWSWADTALVWPLGFAASVSVRRAPLLASALMVAIGLGASILFVWEYGRIGGIPLALAGGMLLAGRNQEAA